MNYNKLRIIIINLQIMSKYIDKHFFYNFLLFYKLLNRYFCFRYLNCCNKINQIYTWIFKHYIEYNKTKFL
jgi:hypothetical protein